MEDRVRQLELEVQALREASRQQAPTSSWATAAHVATTLAAPITALSTLVAAVGLAIAIYTIGQNSAAFSRSNELQANTAASEALRSHFEYASGHGILLGTNSRMQEDSADSLEERTSTAIHALYTANFIYDIAESTDEKRSWTETSRGLLRQYKQILNSDIERDDPLCQELDDDFLKVARRELGDKWCQDN